MISKILHKLFSRRASEDAPFWVRKKLSEMTEPEWESLCDGCGKCCLKKVDHLFWPWKVHFTNIACKELDDETCRCRHYGARFDNVPACVRITLKATKEWPRWLPKSCAYWRLAHGKDLPYWHPLISGDSNSVHRAGISVRKRIVSEEKAGNLKNHLIDWYDDR